MKAERILFDQRKLTVEQVLNLGYGEARRLPSGEVAALRPMLFTVGLFIGFTSTGYKTRFCFPDRASAKEALETWSGQGDPPGPWIAEKGASGNRPNTSFKGIAINVTGNNEQGRKLAKHPVRVPPTKRIKTPQKSSGM